MKWILPFLLFGLVFAQDFTTVIDNELFKIEMTGITEDKDVFEVSETNYIIKAESKKLFTLKNYSVSISPKNLEKLALEFDVPLSDTINTTIYPGSGTRDAEIPDLVCGNYKVNAIAYYELNGTLQKFEDELRIKIPCKSFKSKIIYGIISVLPYPILKGIMDFFKIKF